MKNVIWLVVATLAVLGLAKGEATTVAGAAMLAASCGLFCLAGWLSR